MMATGGTSALLIARRTSPSADYGFLVRSEHRVWFPGNVKKEHYSARRKGIFAVRLNFLPETIFGKQEIELRLSRPMSSAAACGLTIGAIGYLFEQHHSLRLG
jgi:hypothetical protein